MSDEKVSVVIPPSTFGGRPKSRTTTAPGTAKKAGGALEHTAIGDPQSPDGLDDNKKTRRGTASTVARAVERLIPHCVRSCLLGDDDRSSFLLRQDTIASSHADPLLLKKAENFPGIGKSATSRNATTVCGGTTYRLFTEPTTTVEYVVFDDLPQRTGPDSLMAACDVEVAKESIIRSRIATTFFIVLEILGVSLTTFWDPTDIGACVKVSDNENFVTKFFGQPPLLFLAVIVAANVTYYLLKAGRYTVPGYISQAVYSPPPVATSSNALPHTSSPPPSELPPASALSGGVSQRESEVSAATSTTHGGETTALLSECPAGCCDDHAPNITGSTTTSTITPGAALHPLCLEGLLPQDHRRGQCRICEVDMPFRVKHCHCCGRCVERFDHHCFWLGTCIGRQNQVMFLGLLMSMTLGVVWGTVRVGSRLSVCGSLCGSVWSECRLPLAVFVPACFMSFFCVLLLIGHLGFISTNQTTYEFSKGPNKNLPYLRYAPFDQGFFKNWKLFLSLASVREELNRRKVPNTWAVTTSDCV